MELELVYNEETQKWEQKPEPFITIECETEEDFEFIGTAVAFYKKHLEEQEKPQTNADRIRAMSDEELARRWCFRIPYGNLCSNVLFVSAFTKACFGSEDECVNHNKKWLKQPAEEG